MEIAELSIPGAYAVTPDLHSDDRGVFLEWYRTEPLAEQLGSPFVLRQANLSVSRHGVVRGIHYALVPPGQAKYVTVAAGRVIDYVVDLRVSSPTFGEWDSVLLDDMERKAVYLAEGLGHAFIALSPSATVCYLASEVYAPDREFAISPLDLDIALIFPPGVEPMLSDRDRSAPTLAEQREAGRLPDWSQEATSHASAARAQGSSG